MAPSGRRPESRTDTSTDAGALAALDEWLTSLPFPIAALVTGIALWIGGAHPLVAVGAVVVGTLVAGLVWLVLVLVLMSFSAEEAGYDSILRHPDAPTIDEPSARYDVAGLLALVLSLIVAVGVTLLASRFVTLLGAGAIVALAGFLVVLWLLNLWAQRAWERRVATEEVRRKRAVAASDPEAAAELAEHGVRLDSPNDAATWGEAWAKVNRARLLAGRPSIELPLPERDIPTSPAAVRFGFGTAIVLAVISFAPPGASSFALVLMVLVGLVAGYLARWWSEILLVTVGSFVGVVVSGTLQLGAPDSPATIGEILGVGASVALLEGMVAGAVRAIRLVYAKRQ